LRRFKPVFAVAFVLALFIGSWKFVKTGIDWLMTPVREHDRTAEFPLFPDPVDKLRIATTRHPSSSAWIMCSDNQPMQFVLNTRIPIETTYLEKGTYKDVRVHISRFSHIRRRTGDIRNALSGVITGATLHRGDDSDVLISPLLADEVVALLSSPPLDVQEEERLRISLMETGTELPWNVGSTAVSEFAERCRS
jgi:hypothetical protein